MKEEGKKTGKPGQTGKGKTWNSPKTGNKQGKQETVNNFKPYRTGRGTKSDRRFEEEVDTEAKTIRSESNPLEYYTKYTRFAEDAANLPFAMPVGVPVDIPFNNQKAPWAVPGIMRLVFTPTIGVSKDFTSPINRSSTRFYTYLRSNQKASANYDHQDITMMELALDSAYMFHAMCRRIYETANAVTPINEYYVRSLLAAQGVSLQDVSANMQDFRGWINTFGYNLGQFAMPKGITMFDRHRWMCENYYVDGPSSRAQTYIFVPRGFWKYNNTVSSGSELTFVTYAAQANQTPLQRTVAQLMEMGNRLLNAIAGDEDFQYISGDIYNFYGGDTYSLPYLEENDLLVPKYDQTVLSQIENATLIGDWSNVSGLKITQNPSVNAGAIVFNPALDTTLYGINRVVPMNFHWDSPTPGQVIEASRLTVPIDITVQGADIVREIMSCGTEVVNWADVFQINPSTGAPRFNTIVAQVFLTAGSGTAVVSQQVDLLHLAQFDWAPAIWVCNATTAGESTVLNMTGVTWDIENFALIPANQIQWIHEACLWSLFEVGNNRTDLDSKR